MNHDLLYYAIFSSFVREYSVNSKIDAFEMKANIISEVSSDHLLYFHLLFKHDLLRLLIFIVFSIVLRNYLGFKEKYLWIGNQCRDISGWLLLTMLVFRVMCFWWD